MPLSLTPGWNQIQFNLADFTRRAYGTNYIEAVRIQIHANVRVKRVYFCDRLYQDDELPPQLRLHPPLRPCKVTHLSNRGGKKPAEAVETVRPTTPVTATGIQEVNQTTGRISIMQTPVEIPAEPINLENTEILHDADLPVPLEEYAEQAPETIPGTVASEIAVQY